VATKKQRRRRQQKPPLEDWRLFWFACLERAREEEDDDREAQARAELERLGCEVKYASPPAQQDEGAEVASV
jgi:hypothetical protein